MILVFIVTLLCVCAFSFLFSFFTNLFLGHNLIEEEIPRRILWFLFDVTVIFISLAIYQYRKEKQQRAVEAEAEKVNELIAEGKERFRQAINSLDYVKVDIDESAERVVNADIELPEPLSAFRQNIKISSLTDFVAIDVETSGLSPRSSEILSVSAVRFINLKPVEEFGTFIKNRSRIPAEATEINGIDAETVKDAPYFEQISESLKRFIGSSTVVAHNLRFDIGFLAYQGVDLGKKRKYYDTLEMSRRLDDIDSHKLATACAYHGIIMEDFAHEASADSLACGMLFAEYIKAEFGQLE